MKQHFAFATTLLAVALASTLGSAQPAPPGPAPAPPAGDKVDAKSLMQSGVRLLQAHDYLGALAVFKDAYKRFPSAKILLNIGTTLKLLGRDAEAANYYQRFLDARDTDPAKRDEVNTVIGELDKTVGRVKLTVTPPDAEVQFSTSTGDDDWLPAAAVTTWRVPAGETKVRARRDGYTPTEITVTAIAGTDTPATLALPPVPVAPPVSVHNLESGMDDGMGVQEQGPRSALGAFAVAHAEVSHVGFAGVVGLTFDATERLELQAGALLGPDFATFGVYGGVDFALLTGSLRPVIGVGMPVFFVDGARFGIRGEAGIEYEANRHLTLMLDLGVEHFLNPQMAITPTKVTDVSSTAFVPSIGIAARL